ncbi:hypothetical protein HDU96_003016, partial [Phlyctochytrium bullatum]
IPQYNHVADFYSVDCTEDVMPPDCLRQIAEEFEIGEIPCSLVFRNGQEVDRAIGSNFKAFSQIEDHLHEFEPITEYVRLLSKPSAQEAHLIKCKFFQSMGKTFPGLVLEIVRIEKVNNLSLDSMFNFKKHALKTNNRPSDVYTAFHATPEQNIERICNENLSLSFAGATDTGYFGKGLYFSAHADYCARYIQKGGVRELVDGDEGKMIMFDILPGKQFQLSDDTGPSMGQQRKIGFDSHVSPMKAEWVLFDPAQCVPRAVIAFRAVASVRIKIGGGFEQPVA